MFTTLSVQLPTDTLLKLIEQLRRQGASQDLSEAVTTAVQDWLVTHNSWPNNGANSCSNGSDAPSPHGHLHGYQWKSLFLPEGTVLRSWSYGEHNYARVEGDQIMHDGRAVSPNQFARAFARTTRNAWHDLYIRRPGDKSFKLACRLREELRREAAASVAPSTSLPRHAAYDAPVTASASPAAMSVPVSAPVPAIRDVQAGPAWNLPERRKFRYRLEDIAFD